ncbi:metallophosphoesterase family protein [Halorussus halophilus]|uniref:metallophosphoesterase family protein n=1 Tax=Halorussus halophilus TaxID=2650975 RepID=UPI0017882E04|nr:metallophosphoesterase [Halorussus halophilus]
MSSKILVAGDVHLGAENANAEAFGGFLDSVSQNCTGIEQFVLLGDVWDLVRRDPFGCAWETSETVTRLKRLAEEIPVSFVYGNHDTYLRNLDDALYGVEFRDQHALESGGQRVQFRHGQSFDRLQSDVVSTYLSGAGDRGDIDPTNGRKDPIVASGRRLVQRSKRGLKLAASSLLGADAGFDGTPTYPRRERRAHSHVEEIAADKLVYGHTHVPYVHPDNTVANPGSWKSTAPVHNTFLVVEDGDIELYQYDDADAAESPEGDSTGSLDALGTPISGVSF